MKEEKNNKLETKTEDKKLDEMVQIFKEQNPNITEEELEDIKKVLSQIIIENKKRFNSKKYVLKFFKAFIIYLISSLSVLGFFFSSIVLTNKLLSLFVSLGFTLVMASYESIRYMQFIKKPVISSIKPYIMDLIILCLIGFLINEFVKIFEYSIISILYILFTMTMKVFVTSLYDKIVRKKVIVERRDRDV